MNLILHNSTIIHTDMFNRDQVVVVVAELQQGLHKMSQSSLKLRNQAIGKASCTSYKTCGVNLTMLDIYNCLRDDKLLGWYIEDDAT